MNLNTKRKHRSKERNRCLCVGMGVNGMSVQKNRAYKVRATKQKAGSRGGQTKQSRDWRGRQKPRRAATADSITMIPTSRVPSLGVTRSYDPRHRTGQRQRWLWERVLEPPLKVVYSGDAHHARA